jgi:hypothetical protein
MNQPVAPTVSVVLRHARRALLLLGGAFVWWLLVLSGGSAQADDHTVQPIDQPIEHATDVSALRTPTRAPEGAARTGHDLTDTVHQATSRVTKTLRDTPHAVTSTVTSATAAAPQPVRTTTAHLTDALEPVLATTTTSLADTVDRTVDAAGPVVDPILQVVAPDTSQPSNVVTALGAHAVGQLGGLQRGDTRPDAASPEVASSRTGPVRPITHRQPVVPSPSGPVVPAPSSTGGSPDGSALLAVAALIPPATVRRRRGCRDDALPVGPAYPPDSSPA